MKMSSRDRNAFVRMGAIGGKKAADNMTPEQRRDRASKAVSARWAKARERAAALQSATDADLIDWANDPCGKCGGHLIHADGCPVSGAARARKAKAKGN